MENNDKITPHYHLIEYKGVETCFINQKIQKT